MKALIQRVQRGHVVVEGKRVGDIGRGVVVLLGVRAGDTEAESDYLAEKTAQLRIFPDAQDRMNLSLLDVVGQALVVSQFTLHADTRKGNRPSFILAATAEPARRLYERYVARLRDRLGADRVATGQFQASMIVEIVNDGPVTVELRSRNEDPVGGA